MNYIHYAYMFNARQPYNNKHAIGSHRIRIAHSPTQQQIHKTNNYTHNNTTTTYTQSNTLQQQNHSTTNTNTIAYTHNKYTTHFDITYTTTKHNNACLHIQTWPNQIIPTINEGIHIYTQYTQTQYTDNQQCL